MARRITCLRHARRAVPHAAIIIARGIAMPSAVCAAFATGTTNSKECPPSYFQAKTDAECKSLAAIGSKLYGGSVNLTSLPPGCFWLTVGGSVFLNKNAKGVAHANAQLLCAGAPPARTDRRIHRHAPDAQARTHAHLYPRTHPASCYGACQQRCLLRCCRCCGVTY